MVFPMEQIMMTSTTGNNRRGFTLIEMAVVLAIIFILVSSMIVIIPKIVARTAIKRAQADIRRLEAGLQLHFQIRGWYPPDNVAHFINYPATGGPPVTPVTPVPQISKLVVDGNFQPSPIVPSNFTAEDISNILLVHFLTAAKEKEVFIEFRKGDLTNSGVWHGNARQVDPAYSYLNRAQTFLTPPIHGHSNAYTLRDPWGNVYVYDNNTGLPGIPNLFSVYNEATTTAHGDQNGDPNRWFDGLPNNNQDFDLYSMGPNGKTALLSTGVGNSVNDVAPTDPDGSPSLANEPTSGATNYNTNSKWDQSLYNGKERTLLGDVGDDINNFRTGQ